MPTPPRVRERVNTDLPACAEVLAEVHRLDGYPRRWPADPQRWLAPPSQLGAWVAVDADDDGAQPLGHVGLSAIPEEQQQRWAHAAGPGVPLVLVGRLFVASAARRLGLGRRLLEVAASHLPGARPVLEVVDTDHAAIALYRRCGWQQVDTARPGWLLPGETALLFAGPT